MQHIAIISSSVRTGRNSHRVALYFRQYLMEQSLATAEILDLQAYNFPLFEERLQYMKDPLPAAVEFAEKIKAADGVLIVTPEYNGGYPASLKNAIDFLYPEWKRKPVAIASVSAGPFGGAQVNTSLTFTLWKIGALLVPALYLVAKVQDAYDEQGNATDKAGTGKRAAPFIAELLWCAEACSRMKQA
jgi:NAD(P)H-dependent FMN reductase